MNLITILQRMPLLLYLCVLLPGPTVVADDHAEISGPLTLQIEYWSVYRQEERDADGWLLAWKAKASGDLTGEMRWWFPESPPVPETDYSHGKVGYYIARWELWVDDELVLAGKSTGKTVIPQGEDGIWDGLGTVIEANGKLSSRKGHRIYETGIVIEPTDPDAIANGSGMFVIF